MRGADHANVDGNRLRAAQAFDNSILKRAQNFRLRHRIHVANFVQKNRSAVGQLEFALFLLRRASECAFFIAE